jgi:acetyl esterase
MHDVAPRARTLRRLLAVALALPEPLQQRVRGETRKNDRGDALDPATQLLIALEERLQPQELADKTVGQARRDFVSSTQIVEGEPRELARTEDRRLNGLPTRLYVPRGVAPPGGWPLLFYVHGGGWAIGDLRSHDRLCRRIAAEVGTLVLAAEYPLAPEHPFPHGADAVLDLFRYLRTHAAELGADPERIAIGGDSAGGNLSAVTCLRLRDAGEPQPAYQLLLYPATDLRCVAPSYYALGHGYLLTQASIQWYLGHYRADPLNPRASVLLEPDLGRLAPAIVVTAGFDPLRDDGEQYAKQLVEAGVEVDDLRFPSLVHGFGSMDGSLRSCDQALQRVLSAVRHRAWPRRGKPVGTGESDAPVDAAGPADRV